MDEKAELIDEIIGLHKSNNDLFDWNEYILKYGTGNDRKARDIFYALWFLGKLEMIEGYGKTMTTRLTRKGLDWKSYATYEKEERRKQKALRGDHIVKRYWWVIAIVTYLGGIFSRPLSDLVSGKVFHASAQTISKPTYDSIFNKGKIYVIDSLKKDTLK